MVLSNLNSDLTKPEKDYLQLVQRLKETEKYRLVAMFDSDGACIVVTGFRIICSLFSGGKPQMFVDDLVTDEPHRSHGFGKEMFSWLKAECKRLSCAGIVLDSNTERKGAHRFYQREHMEITDFHFFRQASSSALSSSHGDQKGDEPPNKRSKTAAHDRV